MPTSPRYFDLLEAMPLAGCPLCRLILLDRNRYLSSLLYEYVNKYETNQAFRDGRGMCNPHMHLLDNQTGHSLGIAILGHAVIDEVLKIAETVQPRPANALNWLRNTPDPAEQLSPSSPCLLCTRMDTTEISYLETLATINTDDRLQDAFAASPGGLCLPHIRLLLQHLENPTPVLAIQRQFWARLRSELDTFFQKNNRSVAQSDFGPERDSWQRAIHYISGEEDVFGLQRTNLK